MPKQIVFLTLKHEDLSLSAILSNLFGLSVVIT